MEWLVEIIGDDSVLKQLSKVCISPEMNICKEEDCFVLKSKDFRSLKGVVEVFNKACEIVELIAGAAKVATGSKISMGHVIEVDDGGKKRRHIIGSGESQIEIDQEMTMQVGDGSVFEINQAAPVADWYAMAKKNEGVAKVLRLISEGGLDFKKLFILFEEVQGDVGSKIFNEKWATKAEIDRFTRTAQPYRHGKPRKDRLTPPKIPMRLEEAGSLVMHIVENWLKLKTVEEASTLRNIGV